MMARWVLLVLLLAAPAYALECDYETTPYVFGPAYEALCRSTTTDLYCYTYLSSGADMWGVLPEVEKLEGVGAVAYFTGEGYVRVQFSEDYIPGQNTTFNVVCNNESVSWVAVPKTISAERVSDPVIWAQTRAEDVVGVTLTILFIVIIILLAFGWLKKR